MTDPSAVCVSATVFNLFAWGVAAFWVAVWAYIVFMLWRAD